MSRSETGSGARWVRAALQVNPYYYHGKLSPEMCFETEAQYNKALIDECKKLQIEIIAITDHWCVSSAATLIEEARNSGITALPGFEANSSDGVHILVIFPEDTPFDNINAAIALAGGDPGQESGPGLKTTNAIIDAMTARGALAIPAHANMENTGLFKLKGKTLQNVIHNRNLTGIGVSVLTENKFEELEKKIFTQESPFNRTHKLAKVYADDISSPHQLSKASGTTWLKITEPSLEAIKTALKSPDTRIRLKQPQSLQIKSAVSMGGSNEFVECFCWGAVVEGGSGAVVQFVGDGVEVGLVAGDGGSFGKVAADEPVGVFVGSSLPGAVGVSEEHVHAGVVGEALVSGHFPALVPGQCAHRLVGQALDAAGERVTDLVGFPPQRQGDDDQVAGRALNQGRARAGPVLADNQVTFPVARDFPISNVGALINQSHPNNGGFAPACGGFLAHPPARGQANAVFDERLLGVGVDPRVDRLVADRVALSIGRSIHGGQCATRFGAQASADLAGRVPLRQISNHAAAKNRIAIQQALLRAAPGRAGGFAGFLGPIRPVRTCMAGDLTAHHRGATPNQVGDTHLGQTRLQPCHDRRTILDSKHPTTPHDQPPNSTATTRKIAYTL